MKLAKQRKEFKIRGTVHAFSSYWVSATCKTRCWMLKAMQSRDVPYHWFLRRDTSQMHSLVEQVGLVKEMSKCCGISEKNFLGFYPSSAHRQQFCQMNEWLQSHMDCQIGKWKAFHFFLLLLLLLNQYFPGYLFCVMWTHSLLSSSVLPINIFFLWCLGTSAR